MENQQVESIRFHQIRDIPETLNAAFSFIRVNLPLVRTGLLRYVAPFLFLATVVMELFILVGFRDIFSEISSGGTYSGYGSFGEEILDNVSLPVFLAVILLYLIGQVLLVAFVFALVRIASRNGANGLSLEEVWEETKGLFWRVLGTFLGLGIVASIAFALYSIIAAFLGLLGVILALALFILIPFVITVYALYFPVRFIEDGSFWGSFGRAAELVRGKRGATFGLLFICFVISFTLSLMGSLPNSIFQWFADFGAIDPYSLSDPGSVVNIIRALISAATSVALQLISVFPILVLVFHYYSQVERNEGVGITEEIDRIGAAE